jgi:hypothetical protein
MPHVAQKSDQRSVSRRSIEHFVDKLIAEEFYDEEEGVWKFADGSHCSVCFSSAARIAREFDGKIIGYWSKRNPAAMIGGTLCEGHDFTFVANRWVVDYWAFRIARVIPKLVLDLGGEDDRELAKTLFGDPAAWETLAV